MSPPYRTSFFSRLTFAWIGPLIRQAQTKPPGEEAFPPLPARFYVERDTEKLESAFNKYKDSRWALPWALLSTYPRELARVFILSIIGLSFSSASPLILRQLLLALEGKASPPAWFLAAWNHYPLVPQQMSYAIACSLTLFLVSVGIISVVHHLFFVQPFAGARARAALGSLVFKKALRQKRSSHQEASTGFIMNLVASDGIKVATLIGFFHSLWYHPLQLIISIFLLYRLVGYAALIGALSLSLLFFISIGVARAQARLRRELSRLADRRVGLTHESLVHIKAAKFQGWEESLTKRILDLRNQEVSRIRSLARLTAFMSFNAGTAPAVAMAVTCGIAIQNGTHLDAAVVFPMLSLFMLLRFALNHLPEMIFNFVECAVALGRIRSFLTLPEFSHPVATPTLESAIEISDATFMWSEKRTALTIPRLNIKRGELVVVVGSIGSGKSALLLGILGELSLSSGSAAICGSIGYVPQLPWIVSDTVRGNIVCGQTFDEARYARVVQASGLETDLSLLPKGDLTEIGERGVNLSGGQRHRVALARAAYAGAEIFLLDDPLSALDPGVANHVFRHLISREMKVSTRVLVSHRVEYALTADRVVVVENGTIVESGTPDELQRLDSRFSALLRIHNSMTNHDAVSALPMTSPALEEASEFELSADDLEGGTLIAPEDRVLGKVKSRVIGDYFKRFTPGVVLLVMIGLFAARQLSAVSADLWLARSTAIGLSEVQDFFLIYCLCILALCVSTYARSMYVLHRGLVAGVESHKRLLQGVIHAPMRFFESNPVGRIVNRFSRDLETVELSLPRNLLDAGHCLFETLSAFFVIAVVKPITLLVLAPSCMGYYHLQKSFRPLAREAQRLSSMTLSPVFALLSESLAGVETLRAARLERDFEGRFVRFMNSHTRIFYGATATNRWLGIRLEFLGCCIILVVGLLASTATNSAIATAFSGLVLSYATFVTSSMNWAIRSISMAETSLTCFERMERYANTESERLVGEAPPPSWPEHGAVRFVNLSARYRAELPRALDDISAEIPAGSRVGIIGRTGSGKSTLILSIMRLLEPEAGYVEVDGLNLSTLDLAAVRNGIAIVPQEPVLFSGTLRESLDPFSQYSDEQIVEALRRVQLGSLLESLPRGLKARVREGGFNFSSGQRQLLCLARALLRKSHLIILDEATAAIDVETDFAIQRTIRKEFSGATLFVIAHRLGTVLDSDIILGLKNGELIESGAPATLLEKPGSLLSEFIREMRENLTA